MSNDKMYSLVENKDGETYSVFLPYYNLTYRYSVVAFKEDSMSYDIVVEDNPDDIDTHADELTKLMGFVLLDLFEEGSLEYGNQ